MTYNDFLTSKKLLAPAAGRPCDPEEVNPFLFPWQRALVAWAISKGRCGLFCSTGLGKTIQQIEFARLSGQRTLFLAPLAVAGQSVKEANKIGVELIYARSQAQAGKAPFVISNYEMMHEFDPSAFGAVVLDESGILKSLEAKTRTALIHRFKDTPWRMGATATPSPNDISELANHSEFLGLLRYQEVLSRFFVHEESTHWRLKKPAREAFYRWLASWGMSLNHPRDLGFVQEGYDLPPLVVVPVFVETNYRPAGKLFADKLAGIVERAAVRKDTIKERVAAALEIIAAEPDEQWLVWTGLQAEADAIRTALRERMGSDCQEVKGSDSIDYKERVLLAFADGDLQCLVTKAKIAGHGLNWQSCARMIFLGLSDSFESYYQAVRRCWRYGQKREVHVHVILSEPERVVWDNVCRKEKQAMEMSRELVKHVANYEKSELGIAEQRDEYDPQQEMVLPAWIHREP